MLQIFPLYYLTLIVAFLALPQIMDLGVWEECAARPNMALVLPDKLVWFIVWLYFWSLAVEEQFYLIWPLVVFLPLNKSLIRTCGALVVSALLFRVAAVICHAPVGWSYTFTIARWDALACGATIAVAMRIPGTNWWRAGCAGAPFHWAPSFCL